MMSNILQKIKENWFILIFFLLCCYAGYGILLDKGEQLNGVVETQEKVSCTMKTTMDGTYQTYLNTYFENNFPGRAELIRLRSQFLYSLCGISPNENVVIGKDKYLYEPMYLLFELQAYPPSSEEYFAGLGEKLEKLRTLLEENGKELYIFITPSKAHYVRDKVPFRYELLSNEGIFGRDNHGELTRILDENGIPFFDSNEYIEENESRYLSPLFYASGIHWTHVWGEGAASEFLKYMDSLSQWELGRLTVEEISVEEPIAPDTDLYDSLNLFTRPDEKWFGTRVELTELGKDKPNVFMRGSSFMGQSLYMLIKQDVFGKELYFENYFYRIDGDPKMSYVSDNGAYEEVDIDRYLGQSDILILEVNDAGIYRTGMGFIEYLLEHPEYIDRTY